MKKTLVALAVTAFAASSYAAPVFENETTKVDFWGSLRVAVSKASTETKDAQGNKNKKSGNTQLRNSDSRFGVKVHHTLNDNGFYALGGLQVRFKADNSSNFGDLYGKHAFVGLGKKEYGQLTFGKQLTIADDVGLANDYQYGILEDYVPTSSTSAIRYDYMGIDGLTLSANYNFGQDEKDDGTELTNKIKNGYAFGGTYEVNNWIFQAVYGRTNYKTNNSERHRADAFDAAIGYNINDMLLVGVDGGQKIEKIGNDKDDFYYVGPMAKLKVTDKSSIYGNYLYGHAKAEDGSKTKTHGFLAGVDYKFHKNVIAYVEGKYVKGKDYYSNGTRKGSSTNKAIAVGMRVNW